jgi:hypothetical protein
MEEKLSEACRYRRFCKSDDQLPQQAGIILRAATGKCPEIKAADRYNLLDDAHTMLRSYLDEKIKGKAENDFVCR